MKQIVLKKIKPAMLMLCTTFLVACSTLPPEHSEKSDTTNKAQQQPQKIPTVDSSANSINAVDSLLATAKVQSENGHQDVAIATLERAIRIAPRYPSSYLQLAQIRYQQGNYQQTRFLAQKAISLGASGQVLTQSKALLESILQ